MLAYARLRRIHPFTLLSGALFVQAGAPRLEFEAAVIKHFPEGAMIRWSGCQDGPDSSDPSRIRCEDFTLKMLFQQVYQVKNSEVFGPDWLSSVYFINVTATVRAGATRQQVALMFQNLLAERFRFTTRPGPPWLCADGR